MGKFVMKETKNGVKFDLKAGNGEVIATSEVYSGDAACKKGIESVRKNAVEAKLEDQTVEGFETVTAKPSSVNSVCHSGSSSYMPSASGRPMRRPGAAGPGAVQKPASSRRLNSYRLGSSSPAVPAPAPRSHWLPDM